LKQPSSSATGAQPPVTFHSSCECPDNHGEHRWWVKVDPSLALTDASAIEAGWQ
jgi:hypothetical protein